MEGGRHPLVGQTRRQRNVAVTLQSIARALGGTVCGDWINIPGPGHSSSDRSLGILLDPDAPGGFRVNSLAADDIQECRQHVLNLLQELSVNTDAISGVGACGTSDPSQQAKTDQALSIWLDTASPKGSPVETYLLARKCAPANFAQLENALGYHPACPFGAYRLPAMIALVRNVITGKPQGIHRTALTDDGAGKRAMPDGMNAKMMMGSVKHGAIILGPLAHHLGIAEGIETALSAHRISSLPVWALMSASGVSGFPVVPGVQELTIFADHDEAGMGAAKKCAGRYTASKIKGRIHHPPVLGEDWNDFMDRENSDEK